MRYLILALAVVATLAACSRPKPPPAPTSLRGVRRLLPQEFARMLRDSHAFVVNVQSSPKGEIPGTKLVLSSEHAFDSLRVVQPDVTRPVALYCEQDTPSDSIAAQLARAGYASVCFLSGGYRSWIAEGLPFKLFNSPKKLQ